MTLSDVGMGYVCYYAYVAINNNGLCTSTIHTQCTNHGLASALFAIAMVIEVAPHQSIQCRTAPAPINAHCSILASTCGLRCIRRHPITVSSLHQGQRRPAYGSPGRHSCTGSQRVLASLRW